VHQAMALVFLGKAFKRIVLMLMYAPREEAGDADVERTRAAGENVDPKLVMRSIAHAEEHSTGCLGRTPRIGMAEDASSGSLHSPSVSRSAGSLRLGRDDNGDCFLNGQVPVAPRR